jgi:hypothetical protein
VAYFVIKTASYITPKFNIFFISWIITIWNRKGEEEGGARKSFFIGFFGHFAGCLFPACKKAFFHYNAFSAFLHKLPDFYFQPVKRHF